MEDYRFTRLCCGDRYDIRWTTKCKKCKKDFMEPFKQQQQKELEKKMKFLR